jgi:hypothetical protein
MITMDFITALFYEVDEQLGAGVIAPFPSPMPPVAHAECL